MLDSHLTGLFLLVQAAYREFGRLGGGKIINIGSTTTLLGSGAAVPYSASKGGIGERTKALAAAWGVKHTDQLHHAWLYQHGSGRAGARRLARL